MCVRARARVCRCVSRWVGVWVCDCLHASLCVCAKGIRIHTGARAGGRSVHACNMENATWHLPQAADARAHAPPKSAADDGRGRGDALLRARLPRLLLPVTSGHIGTGPGPTPPISAPGLAPPRYVLPALPPRRGSIARTRARTNRNLNIHGTSCHPYWHQRRERQRCLLHVVCMLHVLRCLLHLRECQARVVALQARP